ncbi:MAG TPA: hypothetical protein VHE13_06520 [Opitutus sp.]|nr:hypothetical protein [Opitutus sp.]
MVLAAPLSAAASASARAKGDTLVVSHVYNGYTRMKLPDGGFKPETYAFAEGGIFDTAMIGNDSVNTVGFTKVARLVADALKTQNYVLSASPDKIDQMIMLWYGSVNNPRTDKRGYWNARWQNIRILGFAKEQSRADGLSFTTLSHDFYDELDSYRYFVVLKAYDFQAARTEKKLKLLWESRFSLRQQGVDFVAELPAMSRFAALTFGRETRGIVRPEDLKPTVELGELRVVGEETP